MAPATDDARQIATGSFLKKRLTALWALLIVMGPGIIASSVDNDAGGIATYSLAGAEFGLDGYLRLSYCGSIKDITEGIERMKWALDPNSPNELYIGDRKLVRDWT